MKRSEPILYQAILDADPADYDIAIVSIDAFGTEGYLNSEVMGRLGYSRSQLPEQEQLTSGFYLLRSQDKQPVLFVVTVGDRSTKELLRVNLTNALRAYKTTFSDQKVWVPLMGTGSGGLSFEDSYKIISNVLRGYLSNSTIDLSCIISIPGNDKGLALYNSLKAKKSGNQQCWIFNHDGDLGDLDSSSVDSLVEIPVNNKVRALSSHNSVQAGDFVLLFNFMTMQFSTVVLNVEPGLGGSVRSLRVARHINPRPRLGSFKKTIDSYSSNPMLEPGYFQLSMADFEKLLATKDQNPQHSDDSKTPILTNRLHSDDYNLDEADVLGYDLHASNLFNILTDQQTNPPLNIGILAPWGRGKTSLMRKVEALFRKQRLAKSKSDIGKDSTETKLTLHSLKAWLKNENTIPTSKIPYATVWFNPWNYQSGDMIWAGMANAIVQQVVSQLPDPHAREAFWFKLAFARIDRSALRRDLQLRTILHVTQIVIWIVALIASGAMLLFHNWKDAMTVFGVSAALATFSSVASALKPVNGAVKETLDKYCKPPQYLSRLGIFHEVQEDMKLVFELLIAEKMPLTIFVDDLDRCSPSKIVEVVEAINVFISGDHRRKCYFVLGMDAEIVAASLDVAYDKMKGKIISQETQQGTLGWYFLDKFIQLPFFIPVLNDEKKSEFLAHLLSSNDLANQTPEGEAKAETAVTESMLHNLADEILNTDSLVNAPDLIRNQKLSPQDQKALDVAILKRQMDTRADEDKISKEVVRFSGFLQDDPRTLKRFSNLLRFYNSYQVLRKSKGQPHLPIQFLGKYLSLMLRFPQLVRWIQWDTENKQGHNISSLAKAELIDAAIANIAGLANVDRIKWIEYDGIASLCDAYPWFRSRRLADILMSELHSDATIRNALRCNVW